MSKTVVVNVREDYDVFIGRPSKWGNPFPISHQEPRDKVIEDYRKYIYENKELLRQIPDLVGKRLGCFCKPDACHGDILVELVEEYLHRNDERNYTLSGEFDRYGCYHLVNGKRCGSKKGYTTLSGHGMVFAQCTECRGSLSLYMNEEVYRQHMSIQTPGEPTVFKIR